MKKPIIIIAAFLLFWAAQGNAQTGLKVGVRFNPEFTGLANQNDDNAGAELQSASHFSHLSFGVGAIYTLNENIGLGMDILFSREGQAFTGTFTKDEASYPDAYSAVVARQMKLNHIDVKGNYVALAEPNYIKIPIMLALTTDNSKTFFYTLMAGPQFNILHSVAQEVNGGDLDYPNTDITPKDLYNALTIGGVLALGVSYNLTSNSVISAKLRYDYGFNDAENKDLMVKYSGDPAVRFYSADRSATHSHTIGLMLGLDFAL